MRASQSTKTRLVVGIFYLAIMLKRAILRILYCFEGKKERIDPMRRAINKQQIMASFVDGRTKPEVGAVIFESFEKKSIDNTGCTLKVPR
jgi:hypothetical protein